jgi:hypothetical protein
MKNKMEGTQMTDQVKSPWSNIQTHNVTTKAGHTLQLFYNPDNNLVVVDLIHKNETGGHELLRQTLNESKLLKHCKEVENVTETA